VINDQTPPRPIERKPLWRRRWIILSVLALIVCGGVPAAVVTAWALRDTVKASEGAPYPGVALIDFMHDAFDSLGTPEHLVTVVCDEREDEVLQQVKDYRAQLDDYSRKFNTSYKFTLESLSPTENGDRATLRTDVAADWTSPGSGFTSTRRVTAEWTFELLREHSALRRGWTVCSFTPPPISRY
jgi:hypothetical protein